MTGRPIGGILGVVVFAVLFGMGGLINARSLMGDATHASARLRVGFDLVNDNLDNLGGVVAAITFVAIAVGMLFVAFKYGKRTTGGSLAELIQVPETQGKF